MISSTAELVLQGESRPVRGLRQGSLRRARAGRHAVRWRSGRGSRRRPSRGTPVPGDQHQRVVVASSVLVQDPFGGETKHIPQDLIGVLSKHRRRGRNGLPIFRKLDGAIHDGKRSVVGNKRCERPGRRSALHPFGDLAASVAMTLPTPIQRSTSARIASRVMAAPLVLASSPYRPTARRGSPGERLSTSAAAWPRRLPLRVAQSVDAEQGQITVAVDCDGPVTAFGLARHRLGHHCPLDGPESSLPGHRPRPSRGVHFHISTTVPRPGAESTNIRSIRRRAPGSPRPSPRPVE